MTTRIEFHFDPGCPWTWMTSRWLVEVARHRDLELTWRPFSLKLKNEGNEASERAAAVHRASHRALRVIEAVRAEKGDAPIGDLYTEFGRRIHHDGDNPLRDIASVVSACGLAAGYVDAADDERWDDLIGAATDDAVDVAGDDIGSPVLVFAGPPRVGFFGPIVSPPPTDDAALRLWDALAPAATVEGFFELKRSRRGGPQLGPRP